MLDVERRQRMAALIEKKNGATVTELSEHFGISRATVRRDLLRLSEQGLVERAHGGAAPKRLGRVPGFLELPVLSRASLRVEEKLAIGREAARHVEDGEVLFISGGTTTAAMVPHLGGREKLTVVTNALNIASLLAAYPRITAVVAGGVLRHSELTVLGVLTEETLADLRVDKLFMGCTAIHAGHGLSADDMNEVQSDRIIISSAREVTVLADHTKLDKVATMRVAPVTRLCRIITDSKAPPATVSSLCEQGVEVRVAS
jgi:DeoR/GlpR family transcriptional regulator of sugar metabolism